VIERYKKDVDRTFLRENLKLTKEERVRKAESVHKSIARVRGIARQEPVEGQEKMSASSRDDCPFCAMPSDRVLEANDHAFVVLDAHPVSPGHSLVVARRHVSDAFMLTASEIGGMLRLIQYTRERIDESHRPAGYNIGVNVGAHAGQTVMHVHIHVIPRYPGDMDDPTGGVRGVIPGKARYA
jgi:diadenosine tetraphosphate (Ap4A) HIT family hydrolase